VHARESLEERCPSLSDEEMNFSLRIGSTEFQEWSCGE
jgi:hypothetical protein